jgi:uncharacterized protein (UPF0333 family)
MSAFLSIAFLNSPLRTSLSFLVSALAFVVLQVAIDSAVTFFICKNCTNEVKSKIHAYNRKHLNVEKHATYRMTGL